MRFERGLQVPEGLGGAVRGGDIGVSQKGVELLALGETGVRRQEGSMHTDRIQTRHQWVSLFASFGWLDGVGTPASIIVKVCVFARLNKSRTNGIRASKRASRLKPHEASVQLRH